MNFLLVICQIKFFSKFLTQLLIVIIQLLFILQFNKILNDRILTRFLKRYCLSIANYKEDKKNRFTKANPEVIRKILFKIHNCQNKQFQDKILNNEQFKQFEDFFQLNFKIDDANYPQLDLSRNDQEKSFIVNESPFLLFKKKNYKQNINLNEDEDTVDQDEYMNQRKRRNKDQQMIPLFDQNLELSDHDYEQEEEDEEDIEEFQMRKRKYEKMKTPFPKLQKGMSNEDLASFEEVEIEQDYFFDEDIQDSVDVDEEIKNRLRSKITNNFPKLNFFNSEEKSSKDPIKQNNNEEQQVEEQISIEEDHLSYLEDEDQQKIHKKKLELLLQFSSENNNKNQFNDSGISSEEFEEDLKQMENKIKHLYNTE